MIEVDLNNGMYRRIDLNKPCFCSKCHKEIVRNGKSINLVVNVHTCGYVFCNAKKKSCKQILSDWFDEVMGQKK